jgi:hypothetical protein
MPEGVSVVEDLAQEGLLEIGGDDLGLDDDGALDEFLGVRAVPAGRALRVALDELEDARCRR